MDRNSGTEGDQEVVLTLGPPFDSGLGCFSGLHKCPYVRERQQHVTTSHLVVETIG